MHTGRKLMLIGGKDHKVFSPPIGRGIILTPNDIAQYEFEKVEPSILFLLFGSDTELTPCKLLEFDRIQDHFHGELDIYIPRPNPMYGWDGASVLPIIGPPTFAGVELDKFETMLERLGWCMERIPTTPAQLEIAAKLVLRQSFQYH